jgi:hypothetical protein
VTMLLTDGFESAQGEKRMEQRRFDAAVSILDDAYRLLNGLAQGEDTEHAKAAIAAMQSRVCTLTALLLALYMLYVALSNGGWL